MMNVIRRIFIAQLLSSHQTAEVLTSQLFGGKWAAVRKYRYLLERKKQAGAELGQAQVVAGVGFNFIFWSYMNGLKKSNKNSFSALLRLYWLYWHITLIIFRRKWPRVYPCKQAIFKYNKGKKQAGAELGQAQIRFGLVSIGMA